MTFLHPEFLYYMLAPLFVLFALLLTQKEQHEGFFAKEVMDRLRVSSDTMTLRARNALFFLVGFFMIIALAEPVIEEGSVEVSTKGSDIMVALDISDSMLAADIYPNRLEAAKQKVLSLLGDVQNERIGIVAFAKNSYLVSPLSSDKGVVSFLLQHLDTSSVTEKGTDFLSVLEIVGKMQDTQGKKYLLILSDGGDRDDFSQEIESAKKHDITVFILAVATKKGSPVKLQDGSFIKEKGEIIVSRLNEQIIPLATKTGGVYIEARNSAEDIKTMLGEIRAMSDKKERSSKKVQKNRPLFYYPLSAALLLLLVAMSSLHVKRGMHVGVFLLLAIFTPKTEAGLLDFAKLKEAKGAYESGEFEKSAKLYGEYAIDSQSAEAYFNAGNAFYKQQKYKEAIESYSKAIFEDKNAKAKTLSNLGNAYVKDGSLQKAKEAYEESLKLKDDKQTRENLDEVQKFLEKQKEKQEPQDTKEQKPQENGESSEKSNSGEQKDDKKSKESKEQNKDAEQGKNEQNAKNKSESASQESKRELKTENKKESYSKDANSSHDAKDLIKEQMSDAEQQKYLDMLNAQKGTFLYKLNNDKSNFKEGNEKPW